MKIIRFLVCALLCWQGTVLAADPTSTTPPQPTKRFNDFTGTVDPAYAAERNQRLERFERESSDQFVVAILRQLPPGTTLEDYCLQTFNAWGVGQKGVNNGVVLFVFLGSHKLRVEVGRGLEGTLTNAKAQEIVDRVAACFKRGDFPAGYDTGINGVIDALQGPSSPTGASTPPPSTTALSEARRSFHSVLLPQPSSREPVEPAPPKLFLATKYPAPAGKLAAYLIPDPKDGKKHPAIVWITGGDCNSIGDVWSPAPRDNDQSAAAYRKAGIVMMFPSLRGGNDNPGIREGFLGEVDDVLAAADFLAKQPYVDPARIYLGGHSTGGTLALLVAESSGRFRAVFAFGSAADARDYGAHNKFVPADLSQPQENKPRSPITWLTDIQTPTWVIEGTEGNIDALRDMAKASTNAQIHFVSIQGATHFATLAPTNELIAKKINQDTGAPGGFSLTEEEVNRLFAPGR